MKRDLIFTKVKNNNKHNISELIKQTVLLFILVIY